MYERDDFSVKPLSDWDDTQEADLLAISSAFFIEKQTKKKRKQKEISPQV